MSWQTERKSGYPLAAIVGQERLKLALLLNAINPGIGGVLIRGEKGTAKSTAVRGLVRLLPKIEVVKDCPFGCDPQAPCLSCEEKSRREKRRTVRRPARLVELPVGATEDRLVGSIDLEAAIRSGKKRLEPGLLAAAHRGILYVDEVNLLPDHLVDLILDAAATGVNLVEREGISASHPASFILVGTMNPEEGEIRPQFLDRFGLCCEVAGSAEPQERMAVARLREEYDASPDLFCRKYEEQQSELRKRLIAAQQRLAGVRISGPLLRCCCELALEVGVAGLRADITLEKTARTLAAWHDRQEVVEEDLSEAAELVLAHRRRMATPPPEQQPDHHHDHHHEDDEGQSEEGHEGQENQAEEQGGGQGRGEGASSESPEQSDGEAQANPTVAETVFASGAPFRVTPLVLSRDRRRRKGSGRRSRTRTSCKVGRYVKSRSTSSPNDLALDATLRAAAPFQRRRQRAGLALVIEQDDLRDKVRERRTGNLIVLVVDASGSMGAAQRMSEAKTAVLSLLLEPTGSVDLAQLRLAQLATGGRTPLSQGIGVGYQVIANQFRRDPEVFPLLVLITDGRANKGTGRGNPVQEAFALAEAIRREGKIQSMVVDVEKDGLVSFGLARELAGHLGARYTRIEELKAADLVKAVREVGG
jgi:magnesium chelatase subunit D